MNEAVLLFPLRDYWWFYAAFLALVLVLLSLDLGVFHRRAHTVSFKEAAMWSVVWIGLALAFLGGFYLFEAGDLDAAIELASRVPAARRGGAVEVRPLVEM